MSDITSHHFRTSEGFPEGGITQGPGFVISWQRGPLKDSASGQEHPRNGAFVMDLIDAVIDRIEEYQRSQFSCEENEEALGFLESANTALQSRIDRRTLAGVQGTWQK
jgi:hypothetical protein